MKLEATNGTLPTPQPDREAIRASLLLSQGYKNLLAAVAFDSLHPHTLLSEMSTTLDWVLERAQHYAENTGPSAVEILDAWEADRKTWYGYYYGEYSQPAFVEGRFRVFETVAALIASVGTSGFRCPACHGRSTSAYKCDSGLESSPNQPCECTVEGSLWDLSTCRFVFLKDKKRGEAIFTPIEWELS